MSFADGGEKVDDACGKVVVVPFAQFELLVGEERSEVLERYAVSDFVGVTSVDFGYAYQGKIFFSRFRGAYGAFHYVARFQTEQFDLRRAHVDVIG